MTKKSLCLICIIALLSFTEQRKTNIWMIGDSTMALKPLSRAPESGWGEGLKLWTSSEAVVHNHAASGRSTKSFLAEGLWKPVLDSIQKGDYVIIQFGHNDEKPDSLLHADSSTTYRMLLKKFVVETREKNAIPVICNSIIRRHFNRDGEIINTHGHYIDVARNVAAETQTLFIDMEAITRAFVTHLGQKQSKELWMISGPGHWANWPNGVQDSTHLNYKGAEVIAGLFVNAVEQKKWQMGKLFKTKGPSGN